MGFLFPILGFCVSLFSFLTGNNEYAVRFRKWAKDRAKKSKEFEVDPKIKDITP